MYVLTEIGKENVNRFLNECKAFRKEILDAEKDTIDETNIPTMEDIVSDIEWFIDDDGDYYNGWGVTDSYSLGIHLEEKIDFVKNA